MPEPGNSAGPSAGWGHTLRRRVPLPSPRGLFAHLPQPIRSWLADPAHRRRVQAVALLVVVVLTVDAGWRVWTAQRALREGGAQFERGFHLVTDRWGERQLPTEAEYREAVTAIEAGHESLRLAHRRLIVWGEVGNLFAWVPRFGPQISSIDDVVALADSLSGDLVVALDASAPIFGAGRPQDAMYAMLVDDGERLTSALNGIASVAPEIQRLADIRWDGPFAAAAGPLTRLDREVPTLAEAASSVDMARLVYPALMGYDSPKRYLVMGQNSQEIRPTGGFLGTLGVVTIGEGRIRSSRYSEVRQWVRNDPPYPEPPAGFRTYYGGVWWRTLDTNWYPDFPRSARDVMAYATDATGERFDGAIAVNNDFVGRLLSIFGPLTLPEFREPVTAENWTRQVEQGIRRDDAAGGIVDDPRQFYLEPILKALLERLQEVPRDRFPATVVALREAAAARELQVYSLDLGVLSLLDNMGISGRMPLPQPGEDFVGVVDTNLSETKVGPAVRREITYLARVDGATDVTVRWQNSASRVDRSLYPRIDGGGVIFDGSRYRREPNVFGNYVRVYLPPGVRITRVEGFARGPVLETEPGFTVLSGFVIVRDGQSAQLRLTYGLAEGAPRSVRFWRQSGVQGTLRALVNQPDGPQVEQRVIFDGAFTKDVKTPLR